MIDQGKAGPPARLSLPLGAPLVAACNVVAKGLAVDPSHILLVGIEFL
jgi:hypothetical protein